MKQQQRRRKQQALTQQRQEAVHRQPENHQAQPSPLKPPRNLQVTLPRRPPAVHLQL